MADIDNTVGQRQRINSIDLLRGLVMIIMVLDHARDYFSLTLFDPSDLSQTDTPLFLTRWITHFCAPVFVFLSGTSAWLYRSNKQASKGELSRFLLTRGLWLILLEITLINFLWQFSVNFVLLQVIWVIGLSMVCMAALIYLPRNVTGIIGFLMIILHNGLLDPITAQQFGNAAWLWNLLHEFGWVPLQDAPIAGVAMAYPLIPWVGVMALGYWFGAIVELPQKKRDAWLRGAGLIAIGAFVVLRGLNLYGEPGIASAVAHWNDAKFTTVQKLLAFINTSKYPPSLLYLCMTLGPALVLMPALERWRGRLADIVSVFGRVPFVFYVMHIALIHAGSSIWSKLTLDRWQFHYLSNQPWPEDYDYALWRAYLVWIITVMVLYWPCRWFMNYRKTHRQWWLSYL